MDDNLDWKHPNDVMKIVRAKKRALQARFNKNSNPVVPDNVPTNLKRQNPFSCGFASKKPCLSEKGSPFQGTSEIFTILDGPNKPVATYDGSLFEELVDDESNSKGTNKDLCVDWSLKSKLRLLSPRSFPWGNNLKSSQESSGITSYTRCLQRNTNGNDSLDSSLNAQFHEKCLYWQHPNLPWLNLFPRFGLSFGGTKSLFLDEVLQESLQSDWSDSLRSLYQLVRVRQCPYFYVCSHIFTCLFRAGGISGIQDSHVLITPTNKGIRNILKSEDIDFRMPFFDTEIAQAASNNEQAELEDDNTDEWLESIGIESSNLPGLQSSKQKLEQTPVDNKVSSLIMISGGDIHAFYNFLLNTKITTPTTGPLAGVPPTLLSPVSFIGGALKPLKVRHTVIQMDGKKLYSVDLEGPILPNNVMSLLDLTASNLESFTCSLKPLQYTASFNVGERTGNNSNMIFAAEALSGCGLSRNLIKKFCDNSFIQDASELSSTNIRFENGAYSIS